MRVPTRVQLVIAKMVELEPDFHEASGPNIISKLGPKIWPNSRPYCKPRTYVRHVRHVHTGSGNPIKLDESCRDSDKYHDYIRSIYRPAMPRPHSYLVERRWRWRDALRIGGRKFVQPISIMSLDITFWNAMIEKRNVNQAAVNQASLAMREALLLLQPM